MRPWCREGMLAGCHLARSPFEYGTLHYRRMPTTDSPKDVEKAILGILVDSGLSLTPANIAKNSGYSSGYVRKECNRMASTGLLEKDSGGGHPFYSVTDRGREYLESGPRVGGG